MIVLEPVFQRSADALFELYGRNVTVLPRDDLPIETLAIAEEGLDDFGQVGRRAEVRRRLSFRVDRIRPEPGDQVLVDGETLTVDAVDSDDGIVRTVWVT